MRSFTLDGWRHRLHPKVPAQQIRSLIGNTHVGTSDEEVGDLIRERTRHWPDPVRASAIRYALYCHRKNQKLFRELRL